jgi:hypothetical protein
MAGKMRARWQRPLSGGVTGAVEVGAWYNAWAGDIFQLFKKNQMCLN